MILTWMEDLPVQADSTGRLEGPGAMEGGRTRKSSAPATGCGGGATPSSPPAQAGPTDLGEEHRHPRHVAHVRPILLHVVEPIHVHPLDPVHDRVQRHGGVLAVLQAGHVAGLALVQEIHGQVGEVHGHHAVERVGGAAAHEVGQGLVHHVLAGEPLQRLGGVLADAAELLVPERIGLAALDDLLWHLVPGKGYQ